MTAPCSVKRYVASIRRRRDALYCGRRKYIPVGFVFGIHASHARNTMHRGGDSHLWVGEDSPANTRIV